MRRFFAELKRRKVYRVAVAYAVGAWLIAQVVTQIFPVFEVSQWALRTMIVLLIAGFPVALILSWAFDITPQGIKRTEDVDLAQSRLTRAEPIPEKSIAVLPFENLSDDRQNTYFADGIQDDILSSLAKVADLKVISRTSVRQFRGTDRNLREIGRALGVAHILEGTVRRAGNRVRVNTQLINARTDAHVWSDTFDREMTDLFALQSELAEQIVAALRANISPQERASLQIHPTANLAAYDLYLRARDLFRWSGAGDPRESGEKALDLLDQAITRDPEFALAYSLASRFHSELYWFGYDKTRSRLAKGKAAVDRALQLRPELGDAHLALGYHYYYGYRDYERAKRELAIAARATPNDAEVWDGLAAVSRREGKWDDAVANFERARQLDPHNAAVIWNLGETYSSRGRFDDARRTFAEGLSIKPDAHLFALAQAAIELKQNGDPRALRAAVRKIPGEFDPGGAVTTIALRLSLIERDYDEAERVLRVSSRHEYNDQGIGGTAACLDGYGFPKSWYEGLIARGRGQADLAQQTFESARTATEACVWRSPEDAKAKVMLGLIDAMLGRKEEALREGRRAVELLPIAKDAYDGPIIATNLAVIYAEVGEPDLAIEQLAPLMEAPNGPTRALLRLEPEWDALRNDARFEKLVAG
jgi:TolB-like protein/lipopolysaccharide biosynthesis regulator YciM